MISTLARLAFAFACLAPFAFAGGGGAVPVNNPEPITMAALAAGSAVAGGIAYKKRRRGESEEA
ncbi:MAG: PEP-CTERM sorting domain-containing protein [Planctomycetota bacterium]